MGLDGHHDSVQEECSSLKNCGRREGFSVFLVRRELPEGRKGRIHCAVTYREKMERDHFLLRRCVSLRIERRGYETALLTYSQFSSLKPRDGIPGGFHPERYKKKLGKII